MTQKTKILWPMMAVVVIVAITILVAVSWQFIDFVDDYNDRHLDRTVVLLESELEAKQENAGLVSRFLAEDNSIIHSLEQADREALRSRLEELQAEFDYDVFIITDAEGNVILQSGSPNYGHNVSGQPSIQSALAGEHVSTLDRGPAHNMQIISGKLAYAPDGTPLGVVFIGFHIGAEQFFHELHEMTYTDFLLYVDGYCVLSTSTGDDTVCGEISEMGRLAEETGEIVKGQSQLGGEGIGGLYFPLTNNQGRIIGTMLIYRLMAGRNVIVTNFVWSVAITTFLALGISYFFIYLRAKRISQSIDLLSKEKANLEQSNREAVQQREVYLRTVNEVAKMLLVSNLADDQEKLLAGMELAGRSLGADRVQIWQNDYVDGELHFIMRYRWLSDFAKTKKSAPPGIRFPYKSKAHWLDRFHKGEYINSALNDLPLEDKDIFLSYGIKSFILMPLFLHGKLIGFMKVDDCKSERPASKEQMNLLSAVGLMFASFFDDIVQKGQTEEMTKQLEGALEKAISASKAKSDFLSVMSHEMRTPLNAITGMTHIAKRTTDLPEKNKALNKIEDASSHLLNIVNNVLEMAQIEANKLEIIHLPFEMDQLLDKVQNLLTFRMEERNHDFTIERDASLRNTYVGDEQRILQVLANLLTNAMTYTQNQGKIQLKLELLKQEPDADTIKFSVSDNGIGIDEAQQERLFQMFEQADNSASRKYGGTGLGLAISRNLISLMGGSRIVVDSQVGKGSIFSFDLVLPYGAASQETESCPASSSYDFSGKRILIAEDVEINREILSTLLQDVGIQVETSQSGEEVVDILTQKPEAYDLVLMDIQMPGMDGMEATRKVRELGLSIPILAMTANVFKEDIATYLATGMDDHIGKPIDIEELYGKLRKYLC